jgi:hypothetical protein
MNSRYIAIAALLGFVAWIYIRIPASTILSVRIGQTFDEVVRSSTFPVISSSNIPNHPNGSGATWVQEPAVVIKFNDPIHGFTLPATTFAAIGYMDQKVDDISTSPMLKKVTFDQAMTTLEILQHQFQAGGWQPELNTQWFDLTSQGRKQLREHVRNGSNNFMKTAMLVVPEKYEMTFRLWCADSCDSTIGLDRYLIDIGISADIKSEIRKRNAFDSRK